MPISASLSRLIQDQVALELRAERFYLQSATAASDLGMGDFSKMLHKEAEAESGHARAWASLAEDLGIVVFAAAESDSPPSSMLEIAQDAMQLEQLLLDHMKQIFMAANIAQEFAVVAFLVHGNDHYVPLLDQQRAVAEWGQMVKRIQMANIADIIAATKMEN